MKPDKGWQRRFDDPIPLPKGRQLVTLKDADRYIPKAEQQIEKWQDAVEALLLVVNQNGPTMFARIGVMRALNRKDDHLGRPQAGAGSMATCGNKSGSNVIFRTDCHRSVCFNLNN